MKKSVQKVVIITVVLAFSAASMLAAQGAAEYVAAVEQQETVVTEQTTRTVEDGIIHMREEEKLARDVYLALYEQWGMRIFANIARSEQQHMDTVAALLAYQGIEDPVAEAAPGEFTLPQMQTLYDDLVARGSSSLVEALTVGAIIEDLDIADLTELLESSEDVLITRVYTALLEGSERHMRSFSGLLDRLGSSYVPQYISQDSYDAIVSR
jgi:hypothetical protein